ncbi:hypothetical protein JRO89_XS05G0024100 [Xanthoceras sorbifolium]|uniref:Cytochrome P450 n=1 Tax=Xanthoceras sorbifolium TaxID=99658 RepID=A0ABQ8I015_9ROSI|nr:hypothetical protein JRO89_XS05G0024100 [Xanthoceras sorbifolium]
MNSPMELSHHIFPRIHPSIYSWVKLYGKNFINWYGHQAQLVVTEPELIKEILNNKDGSYPKTKLEGYVKKLLGEGLVTSEGEKWFKQRKLANHAFHGESLKGMIPAMIASVEMMLERWRQNDGKEIDVFQEFRVLTSEVISRTAFGTIHTDWQENVRKEVLQLFGKQNPTPDNIGRLKTMSMVFNETLRLYPPVINLTRRTDRKVKLGNLTLPPNMEVNIPITQLHHNP